MWLLPSLCELPAFENVIIAAALATLQIYAGGSRPANIPATATSHPMTTEPGPRGPAAAGTLAHHLAEVGSLTKPKQTVLPKHQFLPQPFS